MWRAHSCAPHPHSWGCPAKVYSALLSIKLGSVPLVPPYIESLRPYEAGRSIESVRKQYGLERIAKLASNENPLGASPKALEAITGAMRSEERRVGKESSSRGSPY